MSACFAATTIRLFRRCDSWRHLVPRPPEVLVTCLSTSMRWTGFPPEDHISTSRLCSAGSRCRPVPRRQRFSAALRPPALLGRASGPPCLRPPSWRTLVLCPMADDLCVRQRVVRRRSLTGSPHNRHVFEEGRGPPRLRGYPLRACLGRTPRWIQSSSRPVSERDRCCLHVMQYPGHPERLLEAAQGHQEEAVTRHRCLRCVV